MPLVLMLIFIGETNMSAMGNLVLGIQEAYAAGESFETIAKREGVSVEFVKDTIEGFLSSYYNEPDPEPFYYDY
jgi:hypothetical protein